MNKLKFLIIFTFFKQDWSTDNTPQHEAITDFIANREMLGLPNIVSTATAIGKLQIKELEFTLKLKPFLHRL